MNITELPQFSNTYQQTSVALQKQPIEEIINSQTISSPQQKSVSLEQTMSQIFQEPALKTNADKARQILGERAKVISDDYLESFVAQIDYLTNCWLDEYEKQLFEGETLREITKMHGI